MPLDPRDPPPPGRIILPVGASASEPEPAAATPRIVLPPGVEPAEADDLPEYPRLRPLEIVPVRDGDKDYLIVTDPEGVLSAPIALKLEALELMQVLDGSVSLKELSALVARESKDIRAGRFVRDFVSQLDRLLLLDSPRFEQAFAEARGLYHRLEVRQAALEGVSYPQAPAEAEAFLARHFEDAARMDAATGDAIGAPAAATAGAAAPAGSSAPASAGARATAPPRALLVPHLDPRRAGASIARGYLELERSAPGARTPLRVVVFGVGHSLYSVPFALTRKHFETPFGPLRCDTAFVDAVAGRLGEIAYHGELAHRHEHSIEFQALYLRHRFRDRPLTLVPILCGGFHALLEEGQSPAESPELTALIEAVREADRTLGGPTLHVASVDFSHVGVRFGDPATDDRTRREVEEKDRAAIEAARRGDAAAWHQAIASHEDSTRICGWGATYVMLRCAQPGEGRLLHYEQSQEAGGSLVSVAAMAWG